MNKQMSVADVTKSMTEQLTTVGDKLQAQFTAKATTVINKGIASLKGMGASDDEIIRSVKACDKPLKACGYLDPNWLLNHLLREAGISQRGERNDKGKKKKKSTTKGGGAANGKSTNDATTKVVTTAGDLSAAGAAVSNLQATLQLLKKLSAKELEIVATQVEKYRTKEADNFDMRTKGSVLA